MIRILAMLFLSSILLADIDSQIDAIKKVPLNQRYKLINQLKKEIIQMREEERLDAIKRLKLFSKSPDLNNTKEYKSDKKYTQTELENIEIQVIEDRGVGEIETEAEEHK